MFTNVPEYQDPLDNNRRGFSRKYLKQEDFTVEIM